MHYTRRVSSAEAPQPQPEVSLSSDGHLGPEAFRSPLDYPPHNDDEDTQAKLPALLVVCSAALSASFLFVAIAMPAPRPDAQAESATAAQTHVEARGSQPASLPTASATTPPAALKQDPGSVRNAAQGENTAIAREDNTTDRERERVRRMQPPAPGAAAATTVAPPAPDAVHRKERNLPARPTRAQVVRAMRRVTPMVYTCFGAYHGVARVHATFLGRTGRVALVRVDAPPSRFTTCVSSAVRGARVPRFQDYKLVVAYPFAH
jgi:hypothetical protein